MALGLREKAEGEYRRIHELEQDRLYERTYDLRFQYAASMVDMTKARTEDVVKHLSDACFKEVYPFKLLTKGKMGGFMRGQYHDTMDLIRFMEMNKINKRSDPTYRYAKTEGSKRRFGDIKVIDAIPANGEASSNVEEVYEEWEEEDPNVVELMKMQSEYCDPQILRCLEKYNGDMRLRDKNGNYAATRWTAQHGYNGKCYRYVKDDTTTKYMVVECNNKYHRTNKKVPNSHYEVNCPYATQERRDQLAKVYNQRAAEESGRKQNK